jgi:hypothetical protein
MWIASGFIIHMDTQSSRTMLYLGRADAKSASGGGVRGGFAAPRSFLVGFGGFAANTTQTLKGCSPTTLQPPNDTPSVVGWLQNAVQ